MAWGSFCDVSHRLKIAGLGMGGVVVGVELEAARQRLERGGVDIDVADALLTACERGLVVATNEKDEDDG